MRVRSEFTSPSGPSPSYVALSKLFPFSEPLSSEGWARTPAGPEAWQGLQRWAFPPPSLKWQLAPGLCPGSRHPWGWMPGGGDGPLERGRGCLDHLPGISRSLGVPETPCIWNTSVTAGVQIPHGREHQTPSPTLHPSSGWRALQMRLASRTRGYLWIPLNEKHIYVQARIILSAVNYHLSNKCVPRLWVWFSNRFAKALFLSFDEVSGREREAFIVGKNAFFKSDF